MTNSNERRPQPWVTGPLELLEHGIELLRQDSDRNRRLAMIAVDNAAELAMRTYLGLPRRVNGLSISRRAFAEISESFPALLDALEEHAPTKLEGIGLAEIEWYHRLRNELYHQGNGLTVDREKVEVYSQLVKLLFQNLFDIAGVPTESPSQDLLGDFLATWAHFEHAVSELATRHPSELGEWATKSSPWQVVLSTLEQRGLVRSGLTEDLQPLRTARNQVVHGLGDYHKLVTQRLLATMNAIVTEIRNIP